MRPVTRRRTAENALRTSIHEVLGTAGAPAHTHPSADTPTDSKQAPMNAPNAPIALHPRTTAKNRTQHMQLMPEALARAHMHERMQEAEQQRLARALRLVRKAERASLRARRALASVVLDA